MRILNKSASDFLNQFKNQIYSILSENILFCSLYYFTLREPIKHIFQ